MDAVNPGGRRTSHLQPTKFDCAFLLRKRVSSGGRHVAWPKKRSKNEQKPKKMFNKAKAVFFCTTRSAVLYVANAATEIILSTRRGPLGFFCAKTFSPLANIQILKVLLCDPFWHHCKTHEIVPTLNPLHAAQAAC